MWTDLGGRTEDEIDVHDRLYRRWVLHHMKKGKFFGIIAESPGVGPVASGCLWLQPEQPRPVMLVTESPYVLSMYTAPSFRGRGLATRILGDLVDIARKKGFARVVLHAAGKDGRRVYSKFGFTSTPEMRYFIDKSKKRDGWDESKARKKGH
jgi:GNAT superfamily N-acetyltransferase